MGLTYTYPQITTKKSLAPSQINRTDWSTVVVNVTGDSQKQTSPVPTAVVLALDYSDSMGIDNAYQDVGAAAKDIVNLLTPGFDKVAIITIQDTAQVQVPLTTNFAGIAQTIDSFGPGGNTNLKDGFDKANSELQADDSPNKMVIFMSDGWGNTSPGQDAYILNNTPTPVSCGIKYYTIGWGPTPNMALLYALAFKTGGIYQKAPTKADLQTTFQKALQYSRYILSTSMIDIIEVVNPALQIRPNSLDWSFPSSLEDPSKFKADMQLAEATFYKSGKLVVPRIHELGLNEIFTICFDVTYDNCSDQTLFINVDDAASKVTYNNGNFSPTGQPVLAVDPIQQAQLEIHRCDVVLQKDFDETYRIVTLKVRNDLPREIVHVMVREQLSGSFVAISPFNPLPVQTSPDGRVLYWELGSMAPDAEMEFKFCIDGTPGSKGKQGSYEIDGEGSDVNYYVDDLKFKVLSQEPGYAYFDQDLKTGSISKATHQFLATQKNSFILEGTPVQVSGTQPEFGWIIDPNGFKWKVKATNLGYEVYQWSRLAHQFPQKKTTSNYVP